MVRTGKPDKFKGKKKVKNVLDKKAKGLKLNKVDRKRVVKMEGKRALKEQMKKDIRMQLEQMGVLKDEEDTMDSLCSESSFGSQPAKNKKRVSFSGNLERTKVFDKNVKDLVIKPSVAEPGKGILRIKGAKGKKEIVDGVKSVNSKTAKANMPEVPKVKKAAVAKVQKVEMGKISKPMEKKVDSEKNKGKSKLAKRPLEEEEPRREDSENKENSVSASEPLPKKRKIQITRKDKEKLLSLPRKERKAFLRQLKEKSNPLAKKALEAKRLWEIVRSGKSSQEAKDEAVTKLVGIVKGNAASFIYAHDTSRVIECLVSLEREGIRNMLFNELSSEIVRMTKSKYARFFVTKMLKNGSKQQRNIIMNAFNGHIVSLMRIAHAAEVVELAYNDYADQYQRYNFISEFYGKEFVIFRSGSPRKLTEIIAEEPAKKKLILTYMEEHLQVLINKVTIRLSIVHKLILDFLSNCNKDQFNNMVDSLRDKIPEILHTPEGAYAAMKILWNSNAKDRKLIVKNFKDLSVKAAVEHYGHRVLHAIFDTVDDTVLVNKFIISELSNEIDQLIKDKWGEIVLHYLVHPRDGRGMDKKEIERLQEGDSNPHSKKSKADRYTELFKGIRENLYSYIAANMEELIYEHNKSHLIASCLETTGQYDLFDREVPSELRQKCNSAIVEICRQEFIPMDTERLHMIEHPEGGFVLNAVLRCDDKLPEEDRLSVQLVKELDPRQYGSWIACNKGCHVLLKMVQVGTPIVKEKIKAAVNMKQLKEYTFKGALLLVDHLK